MTLVGCMCGKPDPPPGREAIPGVECQHLPFRGGEYVPRRYGLKPKDSPPEPPPEPAVLVEARIARIMGTVPADAASLG